MAIDIAAANTYFAVANHPHSTVWTGFSTDQKTAAIAQSKRTLTRMLVRELAAPADLADLTAFPRDDYAVYEQALYTLVNGVTVPDGNVSGPKYIAGRTEPDEVRERARDVLAPEAAQWLFRGRVMVTRG